VLSVADIGRHGVMVTNRDIGFIEIEWEHLNVDGRDVRLVPGMSVTADLLTGERRVLECMLQPVLRYTSEGGGKDEGFQDE
tara:strand:- start:529 stop:771 length:243 start_codon:yes stop_codon:yes gene_type:complete